MRLFATPILALALLASATAMAADDTKYLLKVRLASNIGSQPGTDGGGNPGGSDGGTPVPDPVFDDFTVSPKLLNFGSVGVGNSQVRTLSVVNLAQKPIALSIELFTFTPPFSLLFHDCGSSLGAGMLCSIHVTYAPTAVAQFEQELTVASEKLGERTVRILGDEGGVSNLEIVSGPTKDGGFGYDFKDVAHLETQTATWVIANTGTAKSDGLWVSTEPYQFFYVKASGGCKDHLGLKPGESCNLTLEFTNTAEGSQGTTPFNAYVQEVTKPKRLELSVSYSRVLPLEYKYESTVYGDVPVGSSKSMIIEIENKSSTPTDIDLARFKTQSPQFSVSHSCGAFLAPYSSCPVTVTFTPVSKQHNYDGMTYHYGPNQEFSVWFGLIEGTGI